MPLAMFLPWFPILLAVGVGGRLLGRARGFAFGSLCALFWVILVLAQGDGTAAWTPWTLFSLAAGVAAMIAMGGWAGEFPAEERLAQGARDTAAADARSARMSGALRMFDEWIREHREDADPWSAFGEFLRMMLHQTCGAHHVRVFRVGADGTSLEPLYVSPLRISPPVERMIRGLTAGTAGTDGCGVAGATLEGGAGSSPESGSWRFAVAHGDRTLGIVQAGGTDGTCTKDEAYAELIPRLVGLFWSLLAATVENRRADAVDPVSGLPTRQAFLRAAEATLRAAHEQREPVAVAVVALERLRELNDAGRWETADELVREAAAILRLKARAEDCAGRFDGSRFVILFRRVDARLAALIVAQIMARLHALCGDAARWSARLTARCGVVGSGSQTPDLRTLVAGALRECHRARGDQRTIGSGLEVIEAAGEPSRAGES